MPNFKLTLVSVMVNDRSVSRFVNLPVINNKAVMSVHMLDSICNELGSNQRGGTVSIG